MATLGKGDANGPSLAGGASSLPLSPASPSVSVVDAALLSSPTATLLGGDSSYLGGRESHVFSPGDSHSNARPFDDADDEKDISSSRSKPSASGMIAIVGRTADPFMKENWEEDFELDDDDEPAATEEDHTQELAPPMQLLRAATLSSSAPMQLDLGLTKRTQAASPPSIDFSAHIRPSARRPGSAGDSTAHAAHGGGTSSPPIDLDDSDLDFDSELRLPVADLGADAPSPQSKHRRINTGSRAGTTDATNDEDAMGSAGEDDEEEEDWDAEIAADEVREAAASGMSDEQISELLYNQTAARRHDHAKRSTLLAGFTIADGPAAPIAQSRSPTTPPLRRLSSVTHTAAAHPTATGSAGLRPPSSRATTPDALAQRAKRPIVEDDDVECWEDDRDRERAERDQREREKAKKKRSSTFAFTAANSQQVPNSTVSHGDALLAQDYTLHQSVSLSQLIGPNATTASLLQSASIATAAAASSRGSSSRAPRLRDRDPRAAKINIVMYPTPSQLYSLKTPEGLSGYNEKQLESWLKTMISKHAPVWRMKCVPLASAHEDRISSMEPLPHLLASSLYRLNHLYRQVVTRNQYRTAKTAHLTSGPNTSAPHSPLHVPSRSGSTSHAASAAAAADPAATAWQLLVGVFSQLDPSAPGSNLSLSEFSDDAVCCRMVYSLLFLGGKLWSNGGAQQFGEMIKLAQRLFPEQVGHFQLLELETLAHHDPTKANRLMRIFVSLYKRYATAATNDISGSSNVNAEVCAQALVSLHLYLGNLSPLTSAPLSERASWDGRDEGAFDWLDHAWAGEKPPRTNNTSAASYELEALTWELCGPPEQRIGILKELYPRLGTSSFVKARVAYTIGHYLCTSGVAGAVGPHGVGNAVVGLAPPLSHSVNSSVSSAASTNTAEHPTRVAERWVMECLYILDQMSPFPTFPWEAQQFAPPGPANATMAAAQPPAQHAAPLGRPHSMSSVAPNTTFTPGSLGSAAGASHPTVCSGLPVIPLMSELACNALILYGDILLSLDKYKYAILAYESAVLNYQYRRSTDFHSLNRRLVDIATKEEDIERNVAYHVKILEKAQADGQLNMYVYIVQQLSKLDVSAGSLRRAEEHLRTALHFLRPFAATHGHTHTHTSKQSSDFNFAPLLSAAALTPPVQQPPVAGLANWDLRSESTAKFALHPSSEFRSAVLHIYLQLARLYLDGDRVDNAIGVLEMIMSSGRDGANANAAPTASERHSVTKAADALSPHHVPSSSEGLTRSKLNQVYLLLATAYMKKKRYSKADTLLRTMEEINGVVGGGVIPEKEVLANGSGIATVGRSHQVQSSFSQGAGMSRTAHPRSGGSLGGNQPSASPSGPVASASGHQLPPLHSPALSSSGTPSHPGSAFSPQSHPLSLLLDPALYNEFLVLRSKIALYSRDFRTAMHFVTLSFAAINPASNLGAMARLTLRRGRIWQRIAEEAMQGHDGARGNTCTSVADLERAGLVTRYRPPTATGNTLAPPPSSTPAPSHAQHQSGASLSTASFSSGVAGASHSSAAAPCLQYLILDASCGAASGLVLADPTLPIQSLYDSYNYFSLIDDSPHMSAALSQIVDTYLCIVFVPVGLRDLCLTNESLLEWLRVAGFDTSVRDPFDSFLRTLEEICVEVLESSRSSLHLLGMLQSYAHLMEIKFMQGRWRESTAFFLELKHAIFEIFVNNAHTLHTRHSLGSIIMRPTATAGATNGTTPIAAPVASHAAPTDATGLTPAPTPSACMPSSFNAVLTKTTPSFVRGLYHTLKRMSRMVSAYQLPPKPEGLDTVGEVVITPKARRPLHERFDSIDSSASATANAPAILSHRFFHLDPTLVSSETHRFARDQFDLVDLFQSFVSEIYGEEPEADSDATDDDQRERTDDTRRTNTPTNTNNDDNNTESTSRGKGKKPKPSAAVAGKGAMQPEEVDTPVACSCTIM